jgi:hypothetical protein
MDQDAVIVGQVSRPGQGRKGLIKVPDGLPEDRVQFDPSKYFKVIQKDSSIKDETVNDRIQREGLHLGFGGCNEQPLTGGEAEWYMRNKGYSKGLQNV